MRKIPSIYFGWSATLTLCERKWNNITLVPLFSVPTIALPCEPLNNRKPRVWIFRTYFYMQSCHLASGKAMLPLSRCHNHHSFWKSIALSYATVKNKDSYCDHMILTQIAEQSCRKVRNSKEALLSDLDSLQITIDPAQSMSRWKMNVQQSLSYCSLRWVKDLSWKFY